jgi:phage terminase Nu1 subunit (DNA packaging protein)
MKSPKMITDEVDAAELAFRFDCSPRMIRKLAEKGIVTRLGRGRYNADASTTRYIRQLRQMAEQRVGRDPAVDGVAANVALKEAQTKLLETRLKKEASQLVDAAEAREAWGRIERGLRAFVMGLPGNFAAAVPLTEHDRARVEKLVADGLEDCALERGYDLTGSSGGN